jgi:predicted transcriptional regulator
MKKLIVVFLAMGLFGAMPAFAAHPTMKLEHEGARECALQAESIQQKVKRIQGEIKKGSKKYSAEDLKKLEIKLKEANDIIEQLNKN